MQFIIGVAALAFLWQFGYFWLLFAIPIGIVVFAFVISAINGKKTLVQEVKRGDQ